MQKRRMYNPFEQDALEAHSSVSSRALLGLRGAMMSGKKLPYDYEIQWIKSDGYAYIDTGLILTGADTVEIKFIQTISSAIGSIFGSRYSSSSNAYEIFSYSNGFLSDYFNSSNRLQCGYTNILDKECLGVITPTSSSIIVNGVPVASKTYSEISFVTPYSARIFSISGNPTYNYGDKSIKIKSVKISRGDTVLDLIPVVKGGNGMMYDRVSGELFDNKGTGSFVVP